MSTPEIIKSNIGTLQSSAAILNNLNDTQYSDTQSPYFSASIGKHVRHIIDHYLCFFTGLEVGRINYDKRQRDIKIEQHRLHSLNKIQQVISDLRGLAADYASTATKKKR